MHYLLTKGPGALPCLGIAIILMASGCSPSGPTASESRSKADNPVPQARRSIRRACSYLKEVRAGTDDEAQARFRQAAAEARLALEDWTSTGQYHAPKVPPAFNRHPDWAGATRDVSEKMTVMINLCDKQDLSAIKACGKVCASLYSVNVKSGVRNVEDVLFEFFGKSKAITADLEKKPDRKQLDALLATCREALGEKYPESAETEMRNLADSAERFCSGETQGNAETRKKSAGEMMAAFHEAYDAVLFAK